MNLQFNQSLAKSYKSASQIIRVLSEDWVSREGYCPNCGNQPLSEFANNQPVADFYCQSCAEQYELKSKKAKLSYIINDGAYATMMARIHSDNNPNFFFLTYSPEFIVNNFLIIPKHFFTADMIIERPPLPATARRAGWVGCNINLKKVPELGKVFLVKNQQPMPNEQVTEQFQKTLFLRNQKSLSRGWTLDMMRCVDKLPTHFNLQDAYRFADYLQLRYPNNNHIKDKIRQQLQILRDKGLIEFLGNGRYRKL
ncbi:DpnI domain-containing protein [Psychrobacter lutiphocae]|uniref:DpnI domain-containing protein n=1 Tax=Psychrobacter lutiphocae TaxID=540500 RepID=UPI00037ACE29|nr:DpnI domain-containing protein [Psychrobacter lutiphocae]